MSRRAIIIGSAALADWSFLNFWMQDDVCIICADGGRITAQNLGLTPHWYVGDSDSGGYAGGCPADLLPSEKDVTDLDMAVSRALAEGYDEIILCGCTGGREDHHLSAIGQLERIFRAGKHGYLLDDRNEIRILSPGKTHLVENKPFYHYFGIVPLDRELIGVTITGAKYELKNGTLSRWESLGISNELIEDQRCVIELREGIGLLIRSN